MHPPSFRSAIDLAADIAAGRLAAADALEHCLQRIECLNPALNAIVTLDRDGARAAARAADRAVQAGATLGPLHGVPVSVKDSFATAGLRTTSSHPPLANHVPARDAAVVARLKAAGAVLVGKTNLPELAGDPQCRSPLFGVCNNPWNLALTPGGSSGGSAVAIAAGFSHLELGSDIGGSIRIPAAYCGVAGFKATENRLPRSGHIPHLPDGSRSVRHMLSFGLLARSVADLRLGLELTAGPDGDDLEVPPVPVQPATPLPDRPLRIAWWDDFGALPLCRQTRATLAATVAQLTAAGHRVERAFPADFDIAAAWYTYGVIGGGEIGLGMPAIEQFLFRNLGRLLPRTQRILRGFSSGLHFDLRRYNAALNQRDHLIAALEHFLEDWDILLCPVAPTAAYPHIAVSKFGKPPSVPVDGQRLPYLEGTISLAIPFALTGSPVVVLPTYAPDGSQPVGLQWIGRRWQDEALLDRCALVDALLGGFRVPPGYS